MSSYLPKQVLKNPLKGEAAAVRFESVAETFIVAKRYAHVIPTLRGKGKFNGETVLVECYWIPQGFVAPTAVDRDL